MNQPTSLGSGTVAALESAWADIRSRHEDVASDVVFITGSGRAGRKGGLRMGSITVDPTWAERSCANTDPTKYREVFIAGETLAMHPAKLLETLIHEAAHSVAFTRGVKDTSRQYRYHNRRFRAICEEMGLEWTHLSYQTVRDEDGIPRMIPNPEYDPAEMVDFKKNPRYLTCEAPADTVIGFSDMHITEATARAYKDTVTNLDTRVSVQLGGGGDGTARPPQKRRTVVLAPIPHGPGMTSFSDTDFSDTLADNDLTADDVQRIGVKVYEGLVARNLLAPHVARIAEV